VFESILSVLDPVFIVSLLALGAAVGYAAGLLGIGGGMVLAPILAMLFGSHGMPSDILVHAAIATSMATILFTSISSVRAHRANHNIQWSIVWSMAPGLVVGSLLVGGALFALLKTAWLALFFSVFVAYNAIKMLKAQPPGVDNTPMPGPVATFGVGAGIGALCGLVGAGGAFLSVPFMTRSGVPIHRAIGTSAALGFPIALASCLGYIYSGWHLGSVYPGLIGYIYWPGLLLFVCTSMLTAPMGARMSSRLPVRTLKRLFACLLLTLATYMGWQAVQAFKLQATSGAVSMNEARQAAGGAVSVNEARQAAGGAVSMNDVRSASLS